MRCVPCGTGYLATRPPVSGIGFYYQDLYSAEGLKAEEAVQYSSVAGLLNRFRIGDLQKRRASKPGDRHLDVGCGVGAFLLAIAARTGATGVGVDFDAAAVESVARHASAAKLPVEIHRGTLAEQSFPPGSFTSASMIHFLEHSYDPKDELTRTARLLAPGGAIVVEVPSFHAVGRRVFGDYWLPYLAPQHLTLFSREALARVMEEAGFRQVQVNDAVAPLVWTSSFVLWWKWKLGTRSRFATNLPMRALAVLVAVTWLPLMVVLDIVISLLLPAVGRGDHIRATGVR